MSEFAVLLSTLDKASPIVLFTKKVVLDNDFSLALLNDHDGDARNSSIYRLDLIFLMRLEKEK